MARNAKFYSHFKSTFKIYPGSKFTFGQNNDPKLLLDDVR